VCLLSLVSTASLTILCFLAPVSFIFDVFSLLIPLFCFTLLFRYDVDNSGTISLAEIRPILVNCGYEDEEVGFVAPQHSLLVPSRHWTIITSN